jgi:hypothetical protein
MDIWRPLWRERNGAQAFFAALTLRAPIPFFFSLTVRGVDGKPEITAVTDRYRVSMYVLFFIKHTYIT